MPDEDLDWTVTITHCTKAGHCVKEGVVPWMKDRGYDYKAFIRNGLPAKEMWDTGCGLMQRVIRLAIERGDHRG